MRSHKLTPPTIHNSVSTRWMRNCRQWIRWLSPDYVFRSDNTTYRKEYIYYLVRSRETKIVEHVYCTGYLHILYQFFANNDHLRKIRRTSTCQDSPKTVEWMREVE